jgi:hypothetical protein
MTGLEFGPRGRGKKSAGHGSWEWRRAEDMASQGPQGDWEALWRPRVPAGRSMCGAARDLEACPHKKKPLSVSSAAARPRLHAPTKRSSRPLGHCTVADR